MPYVDGFLTPVRAEKREAYIAMSTKFAAVYKEHGALRIVDCWPDDALQDPSEFHAEGARSDDSQSYSSFASTAESKEGEVIVFSWMEWPDKQTRDAGLKKVMADPRIQPVPGEDAVFDGRRLIAGGFFVIIDE